MLKCVSRYRELTLRMSGNELVVLGSWFIGGRKGGCSTRVFSGNPHGMGTEGEGNTQWIDCCGARKKTWGFD